MRFLTHSYILEKLKFVRERWVSVVSFFIALIFHILLISIGTRQYLGSSLHPERSNQTVQKLDDAIKKKNMRFVYIKDDPNVLYKGKPNPDAPLSDKDRVGRSPDGGKGESWDPYSLGNSPQRELPQYGIPSPKVPKNFVMGKKGDNKNLPNKTNPSKKIEKEAKEIAKKNFRDGDKGKTFISSNPKEGEEGEINKPYKSEGQSFLPDGNKGISAQIGQMMVDSLKGGYRNTNASRLNKGAISFETSGWDLGPYARIVQQKVESNWRIPAVQEVLRQKGWVAVHFEILKDGTVTNVQVERPSRISSYDQAAVNALKSSSPLPPLPSFVTEEKIGGTFRFFYNMWSEDDE